MRVFRRLGLRLFGCVSIGVLLFTEVTLGQDVPKVVIVYPPDGTAFDRGCERFTKVAANPSHIKEAAARLQEFQTAWDELGPRLTQTALREVGIPYPYREVQATLTACNLGMGGTSSPLLMYVEPYVRTENRRPMWVFAEQLYHELMHTYARVSAIGASEEVFL